MGPPARQLRQGPRRLVLDQELPHVHRGRRRRGPHPDLRVLRPDPHPPRRGPGLVGRAREARRVRAEGRRGRRGEPAYRCPPGALTVGAHRAAHWTRSDALRPTPRGGAPSRAPGLTAHGSPRPGYGSSTARAMTAPTCTRTAARGRSRPQGGRTTWHRTTTPQDFWAHSSREPGRFHAT